MSKRIYRVTCRKDVDVYVYADDVFEAKELAEANADAEHSGHWFADEIKSGMSLSEIPAEWRGAVPYSNVPHDATTISERLEGQG